MDKGSVDRRTRAGDPIARVGEKQRIKRRSPLEELEAVYEDERRLGRPHTPSERDAFVRGFHGQEYAEEIRRLMALGVEEPAEDDES